MINLLVVIIVGAIIGYVASMIMRTRGGLLVDIVVGIVGALLAGWLFHKGMFSGTGFDIVSLLWSLLGAVILLAILKVFFRIVR
jgi:uncharacterized membrane protein YeaQ/YmgE (transglycosylase-associated protein family)